MTTNFDTTTDEPTDDETITATLPTEYLKQVADAVAPIADECIVNIDEGLHIETRDPANVAIVRITLEGAAFDILEGTGRLGVSLRDLDHFLTPGQRHPDRDVPTLLEATTTLEADLERRKLSLESGPQSYTNAFLSPDTVRGEADLPDMSLPVTADVDSRTLRAAVEYIHGFADKIRLGYDPVDAAFTFEGMEDGGTDDGTVTLSEWDDRVGIVASGEASTLLSTDYAADIARSIPDETAVRIDVGEEEPATFEYEFADGYGTVTYMQAPRIAGD